MMVKEMSESKKRMDTDDDKFRELVQKTCPNCYNADRCSSYYGPFNGCHALESMFKMVLVPEEKWSQVQKDLKTLQDINWSLIAENTGLHKKLERIKMLIESYPKLAVYGEESFRRQDFGKFYDDAKRWLEELNKVMEE